MSVAPPRPKGPPLNAMRAFEAAARLESFATAAEELCVTPGAVSQHIKTLEDWAGVPLFQRNAQGVSLTSVGRALLPDFVAAFDALGTATHALRNQRPKAEVHIAALPSVAQLWLPARLDAIRQRLPRLEVSVTALETPPNLARELFDLSIFFGEPADRQDHVELFRDRICPVCAPGVAKRLDDIEQLKTSPLLQDQTWKDDWALWSGETGIDVGDPHDGPRYSLYSLAAEEAKSGAGILMGHIGLLTDALHAGHLVTLSDVICETGQSLVLRKPMHRPPTPEAEQVIALLTNPDITGLQT